jgi:hypothetical protein
MADEGTASRPPTSVANERTMGQGQRTPSPQTRIPLLFPSSNFFWQDAKNQLAPLMILPTSFPVARECPRLDGKA